MIRRTFDRMRRWMFRKEPPSGGGPGGGPTSQSYNRAQVESHAQHIGGGGAGGTF